MSSRIYLRKIAEEIVKEYAEDLKKHLVTQREIVRKELENDIVNPDCSDFSSEFYRIAEEYLQKHGIVLSSFELDDLALILAMTAMASL